MTIQSFTGTIDTDGEFLLIETETGITFTAGTKYTVQVQNQAYVKIADAVFNVTGKEFEYTAGTEDIYIKTTYQPCVLTILENEATE